MWVVSRLRLLLELQGYWSLWSLLSVAVPPSTSLNEGETTPFVITDIICPEITGIPVIHCSAPRDNGELNSFLFSQTLFDSSRM